METLGARLAKAREAAGFDSRGAFATVTKLPQETLWRYEHDRRTPGVDALAVIAKAANVRMEWLATGEGPMTRDPDETAAPAAEPTGTDG